MKRNTFLCLALALLALTLSACGTKLDVDRNTVYVQKKGKIIEASVEPFNKEYYQQEELEGYINERVEAYGADHGEDLVTVDKFEVEDGVANLYIQYAGYEDYARFNGVTMFAGTLPEALAAGFDFDTEFLAVEDGVLGGPADRETVTGDTSYKAVVLSTKADVKVDGKVLFVSKDYTSMAAKDTVAIALPEDAQDGEELALTYIVYK